MTKSDKHRPTQRKAIRRLAELFHRNGYVRRQNPQRVEDEGFRRYKKGDEVRLVAKTEDELKEIQSLLGQVSFKVSRPFPKGRQLCQPIYGRNAVARFLKLVEEHRP